jgi:membrane-associated protease RseP (regulator of RpoE activity)
LSLVIAILGLAFLILVHEAGHFFMARLVGMKPTRFYIGFPPALAKMTRNGIEYGIGAIPLGGYVKIPGMHRMSASDVDAHLGPALEEAPQLYGPTERLKRALAEGREAEAVQELDDVEEAVDRSFVSPGARRAAERGILEAREALSTYAYWRQPVWKRVAVIFAGPGTNLLFAIVLFAALFMVGGG